jgi:inner membrane protein
MRWGSHAAIAGSLAALTHPAAVPVAILGSTAPDWLEWTLKVLGQRIRHRQETHYLSLWAAGLLFSLALWDWHGLLFWFSLGGLLHVLGDALTVTGVPLGPWSDRRFHLFGGRVRTGAPLEYAIAGAVVLACAVLSWGIHTNAAGFYPFFYDWAGLYEQGIVDAYEWKQNRFRFF